MHANPSPLARVPLLHRGAHALAGGGLALGLALLGFMAPAGGLGVAPLMTIAGLLCVPAVLLTQSREPAAVPVWTLAFAVIFIVWVSASFFWSPYENPDNVIKFALGPPVYLMTVLGLERLSARWRGRLRMAFLIAGIGALALFAFELATQGYLTSLDAGRRNNPGVVMRNLGHGISVMVLLLPGFVALAWRGGVAVRALVAGIVLVTIAGAFGFGIHANVLGLACAAFIGLGAAFAPRAAMLVVGTSACAAVLGAPVIAALVTAWPQSIQESLPLTWEYRVLAWGHVNEQINAAWLFGHGFDASRTFHDEVMLRGTMVDAVPLHPHNAGLQVWLETGLVGALLLTTTLALWTWRLTVSTTMTGARAAVAASGAAGFLGLSLVSYGVWQEWWIACGFLVAVITALFDPYPAHTDQDHKA